jgi:hypothetical protein
VNLLLVPRINTFTQTTNWRYKNNINKTITENYILSNATFFLSLFNGKKYDRSFQILELDTQRYIVSLSLSQSSYPFL